MIGVGHAVVIGVHEGGDIIAECLHHLVGLLAYASHVAAGRYTHYDFIPRNLTVKDKGKWLVAVDAQSAVTDVLAHTHHRGTVDIVILGRCEDAITQFQPCPLAAGSLVDDDSRLVAVVEVPSLDNLDAHRAHEVMVDVGDVVSHEATMESCLDHIVPVGGSQHG